LPEVIKEIPYVKLVVIGTGPMEGYFKEEVKKRNIDANVVFLGYVESDVEIEKMISSCRVGIAPYAPSRESFTWYADPGKPKVYLGCGVPVIITKVPEIAFEISRREAGVAINYDKNELADAIVKLLKDEKFYERCKGNARKFASELSWDNIFGKAFCESFEM
jgi:glycosyltransferase involved in cell wall biosynthesis